MEKKQDVKASSQKTVEEDALAEESSIRKGRRK